MVKISHYLIQKHHFVEGVAGGMCPAWLVHNYGVSEYTSNLGWIKSMESDPQESNLYYGINGLTGKKITFKLI